MHSSRMRTARLLTVSRSSIRILVGRGEECGGLPSEGVMGSAFPWHCGNADTPVNRQTSVKTLPFPILRMRAIKSCS